jgi:hypothetical protein
MGARYYDPKLARFVSADTIVPLPFYPQSLNRYSFTLNNPIVIRELNGHCFAGPSSPPSGFWASVGSALSSIGHAIGSFAGTAITTVANFIGGAIATAAGFVTGVVTGFNTDAMTSVADSIMGGANGFAVAIGGAVIKQSPIDVVGGTADASGKESNNRRLIKASIDGVQIKYKNDAEHPIDTALAVRFEDAVSLTKQNNPDLISLLISATTNDHEPPSLHVEGYAIDISRVNGLYIGGSYGNNSLVTAIVQGLQTNFSGAYENYGPAMMIGGRNPQSQSLINSHQNHIHFSIK